MNQDYISKIAQELTIPPKQVQSTASLLEEGATLAECSERSEVCERSPTCPTRLIWQEAAKAMFDKLNTITLADLLHQGQAPAAAAQELRHVL